ncbi:MAG TPA: methyltransferase domain-containing protein, partial [Thiomicrospira sp.]|nr:methyltransferase domain-containing protein [Thiomicrospira sp.]
MNQGFQQFLKHWFKTSAGLAIFNQEKQLIDKYIENLFGYFLVQLGCVSTENLTQNSRISSKLLVDDTVAPDFVQQKGIYWVQAELHFLPIGQDKADVVILPHTLETVDDPYYLLRRVDNMLLPEGHIVLTGFNPIACMPFRLKYFSKLTGFKKAKFRRANRIKEWLEVLG